MPRKKTMETQHEEEWVVLQNASMTAAGAEESSDPGPLLEMNPAAVGRQSNFVAITKRGTNTNFDSCFYFPVCTSEGCGSRKENCQFAKPWKKIVEELGVQKKAATTAAGVGKCCFHPLCPLTCGGQSEACQSLHGWLGAMKETKEFLETKRLAKNKQRSERTRAFRAARKKEKERMLRSCIFNEPTI